MVPLHFQIYLNLKKKIEEKVIIEGEKLPSETELQRLFDVSRITIRKAIESLEADGLVKKYQGKGTIVKPLKYNYNLQELTSFSADAQKMGGISHSEILTFKVIKADVKVSNSLNIEIDGLVYFLERLRMSGEKIVGLHKAYIPKGELFQIENEEINNETSLYKLLEGKGVKLKSANEILEARTPNKELKDMLKLMDNQAIFYKERTTFDENNKPIEYVEMFYNSDSYRYKVSMDIINSPI